MRRVASGAGTSAAAKPPVYLGRRPWEATARQEAEPPAGVELSVATLGLPPDALTHALAERVRALVGGGADRMDVTRVPS